MLSLVISVILILKVEANEPAIGNNEIRLNNIIKKDNFTVWKDKPLKIIIENSWARYIWCVDFYVNSDGNVRQLVNVTELNNDIVSVLNVTNVTAEMSTKWKCTVLQNYIVGPSPPYPFKNGNYTPKEFLFHLHVKGAKKLNLTANNRILTYVTTDLSVNYDGEANYTYVDGEDLQISCKKVQNFRDTNSTLHLEYYNAAGILLFRTEPRYNKPHVFGSVLKSNNDNYYLDCIRTTYKPVREYRYRTIFLMEKESLYAEADQNTIMLSVNGEKLTSISKEKSYDDYIFRYKHSGLLNVTCQKLGYGPGKLKFYSNIKDNIQYYSRIVTSQSGAVISLNVSTSNLNNKTLICVINNTEVLKPNARILFLRDELARDIRLRGLSSNNVMYEYTNNENQWTIEYQYSVNETFNVTCEVNTGFQSQQSSRLASQKMFQWKFKGRSNDSAANYLHGYMSIQWSENPFTQILDETHNRTKLQCIYLRKGEIDVIHAVELIFRLKPEPSSEASLDTPAEDSSVQILVIAASVGTIGIITVICLFLWRKRTKRTRLIESESDNLSNQNNSPIPAFPSQWETNCDDSHYNQIDEGVMEENDTYLIDTDNPYQMPYKRQSNNSENHYTEIDDYFKPKPGGLAANWSSAYPVGTQPHNSKNAPYNHFHDLKKGTYDNLRHDNLPFIQGNERYSNIQQAGKRKNVTFEETRNEFTNALNFHEGTCRQDSEKYNPRLKDNNVAPYANINQNIYMQPDNLPKQPKYENLANQNHKNHLLKNEKPDLDYAEPYGDLGIRCKNDFFR